MVGITVTERLDRLQRQHTWAGFPLAVVYKYFDDFGAYLAALLTYYGFISLFPLLLLLSTILGFVLSGDQQLQHQVLTSALHEFPVIGQGLAQPRRLGGGPVGLAVGILGSLYGGLGVAQAFQYAMNTAWGIPRNDRPNPFQARGRSLVLLFFTGVAVLGTTALSILSAGGAGALGVTVRLLALLASVLVNVAVSVFAFRFAAARRLSVQDVLPGAAAAAVSWQLLQSFGVFYVRHVIKSASATNAVFALVLGLLAFLFITFIVVLLCVEVNVVRINRIYPRSLLTPFTDNVVLTAGDRRAYSRQAKAQRSKGFQHVEVKFDQPAPDPEPGSADLAAAGDGPAAEGAGPVAEVLAGPVAEVMAAERELLRPEVRSAAGALGRLLDPDFREIGASGRLWSRPELIEALTTSTDSPPGQILDTEMEGRQLTEDLVELTYISDAAGRRARRTSLWRRSAGTWRLLHHQGTLLP